MSDTAFSSLPTPLSTTTTEDTTMPPITEAQADAISEYYEKRKPYNALLQSVLDRTPYHPPRTNPVEVPVEGEEMPAPPPEDEEEEDGKGNEKEDVGEEVPPESDLERMFRELMAKFEESRIDGEGIEKGKEGEGKKEESKKEESKGKKKGKGKKK